MSNTEVQPVSPASMTIEELRAWDWRAELTRQERQITWLARHTQRSESAVRKYASGTIPTPDVWLRQAAIVLGRAV